MSGLAPGESAIYTAMFPAQDFMTNNVLDLITFFNLAGVNTAMIDVFVNGALVGSTLFGPGFAPDIVLTGASAAGTSLDLVFTASVGNIGSFSFSGDGIAAVQAVPEPATMTLLGLGMTGVAAGFWRKRKKDKAPVEVAC